MPTPISDVRYDWQCEFCEQEFLESTYGGEARDACDEHELDEHDDLRN